jgi:hypothetical protein
VKSILLALVDNARVLALLLGITLLILGDAKSVTLGEFHLDLIGGGISRAVFLTMGSLLALLSSFSILMTSLQAPLAKDLAKRRAGIEFTFPRDNQSICGEFSAEGKFRKRPRARDVRVFVASTHDKRIWPQGSVVFDEKSKTWNCRVNLWEHPKPDAYLFIAELGEDSVILCDYYGTVGRMLEWTPIRQLTSDSIEHDRVRVHNSFNES